MTEEIKPMGGNKMLAWQAFLEAAGIPPKYINKIAIDVQFIFVYRQGTFVNSEGRIKLNRNVIEERYWPVYFDKDEVIDGVLYKTPAFEPLVWDRENDEPEPEWYGPGLWTNGWPRPDKQKRVLDYD